MSKKKISKVLENKNETPVNQVTNTSINQGTNQTDLSIEEKYYINYPKNADPLPLEFYYKPYTTLRRAKIILFSSVFKQHKSFTDMNVDNRFDLLKKIENSCYDYVTKKALEYNIPVSWECDNFSDIYTITCAKIASNIDQENSVKNKSLYNNIMNGSIDINQIPKMTSQEIYPSKYKHLLEQLEKSKNVLKTIRTTKMYTCRRCKKSECTYENLYNRSLDEGVNLKITCVSCGLEWKG